MEERELAYELLKRFNEEKIELQQIKEIFNGFELKVISNLFLDGSLIKCFDTETKKENVVLSVKGKHLLFIHENEDKIKEFESILEYQGYNTEYLADFIKGRSIDGKLDNIFSIEDYDAFSRYTRKIEYNATQKLVLKKGN